jgi:hypothetical protein
MPTRGFVFGALSLLSLGCQNDAIVINSERAPILGGDPATVGQFPSVVGIGLTQGQGGLCTGTLIAPDVVLTAAHCIDPELSGLASLQAVANATVVIFNSTNLFGNQGFAVGASQVIQHPQAPNFTGAGGGLGQHDIGVIILDSPVNNIQPSPVELDPSRNLIGLDITAVGYGLTNPANQNSAGSLFFVNDTTVSCTNQFGGSNTALVCLDQNDGTGSCSGDSGGPMFDASGKILGVTSFGDQGCQDFGAYSRASFEADFVAQFLDGAPPPDCDADNSCNAFCSATPDPDCLDCDGNDGTCTQGCGQNGNPADDDCDNPCLDDGICNQNCAFLNQVDPNCLEDEGGCAVTPMPSDTKSTTTLPIVALFGLFGLGLLVSRKRSA